MRDDARPATTGCGKHSPLRDEELHTEPTDRFRCRNPFKMVPESRSESTV